MWDNVACGICKFKHSGKTNSLYRPDVFYTKNRCFKESYSAMSKNLKKYLQKSLFLYVKSHALRLLSLIRNNSSTNNLTDSAEIFWHFGCFHIYSQKFLKMWVGKIFGKCSNTVSLPSLTTSIPFTTWFLPRKCWKWKISLKLGNYLIRIIVMSDVWAKSRNISRYQTTNPLEIWFLFLVSLIAPKWVLFS